MNQSIEHIQRINHKVQLLIKQRDSLMREREKLQQELNLKQQGMDELAEKVSLMEDQVVALRAAASQMDDKQKKEFEKRISGFIKDIDKVIAHLQP